MGTDIVYFDETGDDGNNQKSSDHFILTSFYMPAESWGSNFQRMRDLRKNLKVMYGYKIKEEMHTKQFLTNKNPYAMYDWSDEVRKDIVIQYARTISEMDGKAINVIIDKRNITSPDYQVLDTALTYSLQRIENDSNKKWNYIVITDEGRLATMRRTARRLQIYNPIPSHFKGIYNQPLNMMIEDILEKNSAESYFIQVCDYISYFAHLHFLSSVRMRDYPGRIASFVDADFVLNVLGILKDGNILNVKANTRHEFGFVIYPK